MSAPTGGWRAVFDSRWFIIIGVVVLLFLSVAYARAWYQEYQIHAEISQLQSEAERLQNKKLETLAQLAYVQSSTFIEGKARTELNLAKPGEHVVVVPVSGTKALEQNKAAVVQSVDPGSNYTKWLRYFTHPTGY